VDRRLGSRPGRRLDGLFSIPDSFIRTPKLAIGAPRRHITKAAARRAQAAKPDNPAAALRRA
jgi:hypothetical protein